MAGRTWRVWAEMQSDIGPEVTGSSPVLVIEFSSENYYETFQYRSSSGMSIEIQYPVQWVFDSTPGFAFAGR